MWLWNKIISCWLRKKLLVLLSYICACWSNTCTCKISNNEWLFTALFHKNMSNAFYITKYKYMLPNDRTGELYVQWSYGIHVIVFNLIKKSQSMKKNRSLNIGKLEEKKKNLAFWLTNLPHHKPVLTLLGSWNFPTLRWGNT